MTETEIDYNNKIVYDMNHVPIKVGELVGYKSSVNSSLGFGVVVKITNPFGPYKIYCKWGRTSTEALTDHSRCLIDHSRGLGHMRAERVYHVPQPSSSVSSITINCLDRAGKKIKIGDIVRYVTVGQVRYIEVKELHMTGIGPQLSGKIGDSIKSCDYGLESGLIPGDRTRIIDKEPDKNKNDTRCPKGHLLYVDGNPTSINDNDKCKICNDVKG